MELDYSLQALATRRGMYALDADARYPNELSGLVVLLNREKPSNRRGNPGQFSTMGIVVGLSQARMSPGWAL